MTAELPSLSLYHLDAELLQLLQYREERAADTVDPPSEDEMRVLDAEISKYLEALPKKVSSVAAIFRHWDGIEAMADKELARIAAYKAHIKAQRERLKGYVADILERQPQPAKGCKKLTGADGSVLLLKGNGGLAPLKIQDEVLPDDFVDITVRMPRPLYRSIIEREGIPFWNIKTVAEEPANGRIREALKEGSVPGAWLEERGSHVVVK